MLDLLPCLFVLGDFQRLLQHPLPTRAFEPGMQPSLSSSKLNKCLFHRTLPAELYLRYLIFTNPVR